MQRDAINPFDVRDNRVMVSLGPLSSKHYCNYRCPFCYVHADFLKYSSMQIDDIISWIKQVHEPYDVIYVSGDTDSFAPPRSTQGITLLEKLFEFDVDLLFTTRAVFNELELNRLSRLSQACARKGRLLFGCVSVAQLHHSYLEPRPIPPPEIRIQQLGKFKEIGIVSVLAMRPFLPVIAVSEYLEILQLSRANVDVILGEVWYSDLAGKLDRGVFKHQRAEYPFILKHMDFDTNQAMWKVFEATDIRSAIEAKCAELNVPFFMRSRPAIEWARNRGDGRKEN